MRRMVLFASFMTLGSLLGCDATSPSVFELQQQRAHWVDLHLTKYTYDYKIAGFFNNLSGQTIHIIVLADTVRSAVVVATGDTIAFANRNLPTINGLFDQAVAAREAGTLTGITFDPVLGYPRRIELSGPPDASGPIIAWNLKPLP